MNVFDLVIKDKEIIELEEVFLAQQSQDVVNQLIKEYKYRAELSEYNLKVNHKVLLHGASGCGKTMLAKAIAAKLDKPLIILNLSNIINARIGETSQNIKQLFEKAIREKAILFLDEFDQIGKQRVSDENDVGEMRRLVNSVIQQMDYLPDSVMLVAATNHVDIIDDALLRRFQLRIPFDMPLPEELDKYYDNLLQYFPSKWHSAKRKYQISFAEAKDYILTQVKQLLIEELESKS